MNEPEKFTDYAAWHARCCDRGDEGPYYIVGAGGKRSQFVRDGEGTSAMWNHAAGWGYVFALADRDPTPYCSACGAKKEADCHCGPIADNE